MRYCYNLSSNVHCILYFFNILVFFYSGNLLFQVKKANPNAEFKEISNLLGAKWKTISAEEKKPYEEKYQAEKEAYLKIVGKEKRELEAMRLLDEEQKQKTAMELLEQYIQFQQGAIENENKKKK